MKLYAVTLPHLIYFTKSLDVASELYVQSSHPQNSNSNVIKLIVP